MTNQQLGRKMQIASLMTEFATKGSRTLKDLEKVINFPANLIYKLVHLGYVKKEKRGLFNWNYTIKDSNIQEVAQTISINWNRNVYRSKESMKFLNCSDNELLIELQRRGYKAIKVMKRG